MNPTPSPKPPASNRSSRLRLDQALVALALLPSREKAQIAILAGQVRVKGRRAQKPSDWVHLSDAIELESPERYVSRGGLKLEHALRHFQLSPAEASALDLGASTGGFTDCLLQHGAARVYAVDVGHGQLAWKLRQDPRVVVMEKTNARNLSPHSFPQPFQPFRWAVADCSFISLKLILPPLIPLLDNAAKVVALVKPQFEAGRAEASKGAGVIRDAAIHDRILRELQSWTVQDARLSWRGVVESPILGPAGNKEFLVWLEKTG
ncbi:MAG: TlyA family RNA methyltransferase [Verrucomicrobia bacterium]|nr:TlyA family RNA methyltransferase [Verrucomicrobiota bacterium]